MNQVINKLKKQIIDALEEDDFTGAKNQIDKLVAISTPSLPEIVIWEDA